MSKGQGKGKYTTNCTSTIFLEIIVANKILTLQISNNQIFFRNFIPYSKNSPFGVSVTIKTFCNIKSSLNPIFHLRNYFHWFLIDLFYVN